MWKQRLKKFIDNPLFALAFLRTKLQWKPHADDNIKEYSSYIFLSGKDTIAAITSTDRSIIRVGDGTFGYLLGSSIYFNNWHFRYNHTFAKKLEHVMKNGQDNNILFCYPHTFVKKTKAEFESEGIGAEWGIWTPAKIMLRKFLRTDKQYGDSVCFHPRYNSNIDFFAIKKYLNTKHVIIITSNTERFKDIKLGQSTTLIEAPSSDAWQVYEDLEKKGLAAAGALKVPKNEILFMISAAEAAKVMIYDLTKLGYTAWDTGQFFDMAAKEITALGNLTN